MPDERKKEEVAKILNRIEHLQIEKKKAQLLEQIHADEFERLENFGEIRIFDDTPTVSYLKVEG